MLVASPSRWREARSHSGHWPRPPRAQRLPAMPGTRTAHFTRRAALASDPNRSGQVQLARAAIVSANAIKECWPDSTTIWAEPLIHVAPHDRRRKSVQAAEANLRGMYEAYDWIMGLAKPELGGDPSYADVVGLNYYPH